MRITLKLYAMLTEYLPPGAEKNISPLELAEGTSIDHVVRQLALPRDLVHLVLLNGVYVAPEQLADTPLQEGDVLAIWPPVAGG